MGNINGKTFRINHINVKSLVQLYDVHYSLRQRGQCNCQDKDPLFSLFRSELITQVSCRNNSPATMYYNMRQYVVQRQVQCHQNIFLRTTYIVNIL